MPPTPAARPPGYRTRPDLVILRFNPPGPTALGRERDPSSAPGEAWSYLAAVIDLISRRVVGWATSTSPDTDLSPTPGSWPFWRLNAGSPGWDPHSDSRVQSGQCHAG